MSEDDFKILVRDKLEDLSRKTTDLNKSFHAMEIEQTKMKTKIGIGWVILAGLHVSGFDIPQILSALGN
jgi:hypothetical protein